MRIERVKSTALTGARRGRGRTTPATENARTGMECKTVALTKDSRQRVEEKKAGKPFGGLPAYGLPKEEEEEDGNRAY